MHSGIAYNVYEQLFENAIDALNQIGLDMPENASVEFLDRLLKQVQTLLHLVRVKQKHSPHYIFCSKVEMNPNDLNFLRMCSIDSKGVVIKGSKRELDVCNGECFPTFSASTTVSRELQKKVGTPEEQDFSRLKSIILKFFQHPFKIPDDKTTVQESQPSPINGVNNDIWNCLFPCICWFMHCGFVLISYDTFSVMWLELTVENFLSSVLEILKPLAKFMSVNKEIANFKPKR